MCYLAAAVKMHRLKVCGGEEGHATLHRGEGLLCLLDRTNTLDGKPLLWRLRILHLSKKGNRWMIINNNNKDSMDTWGPPRQSVCEEMQGRTQIDIYSAVIWRWVICSAIGAWLTALGIAATGLVYYVYMIAISGDVRTVYHIFWCSSA